MPKFIFSFEGGWLPSSKEEGEASMNAWSEWMKKIKGSLVDGGGPVGKSKTVSSSGVANGDGSEPLMRCSIVRADNIDKAVELLKGCPHLISQVHAKWPRSWRCKRLNGSSSLGGETVDARDWLGAASTPAMRRSSTQLVPCTKRHHAGQKRCCALSKPNRTVIRALTFRSLVFAIFRLSLDVR